MELTREKVLAMEAGAEMDELVMKVIFGAEKGYYGDEEVWYHHDKNGYPDYEWPNNNRPSTDISAAWEVLEKISGQNDRVYMSNMDGLWWITIDNYIPNSVGDELDLNVIDCSAEEAPLAICRAALLTTITE